MPASADEKLVLWVQDDSVDGALSEEVKRLGGEIKSYGHVLKGVNEWTEGEKKGRIVCDGKVSWALVQAAGEVRLLPVVSSSNKRMTVSTSTGQRVSRRRLPSHCRPGRQE